MDNYLQDKTIRNSWINKVITISRTKMKWVRIRIHKIVVMGSISILNLIT
jgi:hypothetical protein